MGFYNKKDEFYRLVGNNVANKTNQTIDNFLNSIPNKYSNAGLILNHIKGGGVSGNTTIGRLLSTPEYFGLINEGIRLANITNTTDFYQEVLDKQSTYTEQNNVINNANQIDYLGYSGGSICYTSLSEVGESIIIKSVPTVGDLKNKIFRLNGFVYLNESDESSYVIPLGLLSLDGDYTNIGFGDNQNSVTTTVSSYGNVGTSLSVGSVLTLASDDQSTVGATQARLVIDSNLLSPPLSLDDYVIYLIVKSTDNFNKTVVHINQDINIVTTGNNEVRVEFSNL
jgi:hypothetical protein